MNTFEVFGFKMICWFGFGFGVDSKPNRYGMTEHYMVLPFIKIKIT